MNHDRLANLLRTVDEQRHPALRPDLASLVRHRARRQHRRRVAFAAAAPLALLAVALAFNVLRSPGRLPSPSPLPLPDHRQALADLEREAALRLELARLMTEAESRARRPDPTPPADPLALIQHQRERAAFILVNQADRLLLKFNRNDDAAREYQQVIHLFPRTRGAQLARERLLQTQPRKEG